LNCSELRSLVQRQPWSLLSAADQAQIRDHAANCSSCAEFVESSAAIEMDLADLPEVACPGELCDRIMEQILTSSPEVVSASSPAQVLVPSPAVSAASEISRGFFIHFLKNVAFVFATASLLIGADKDQLLRHLLAPNLGLNISTLVTLPYPGLAAALSGIAGLLFLTSFLLAEQTELGFEYEYSEV